MWVISQSRLREFWKRNPRAEEPLRMWHALVSAAEWKHFTDLRAMFPSADRVGNCIVFNIAGNRFRLIARAFFGNHKVYVLRILTHAAYDRENWAIECRCDQPQPKRTRPAGKS